MLLGRAPQPERELLLLGQLGAQPALLLERPPRRGLLRVQHPAHGGELLTRRLQLRAVPRLLDALALRRTLRVTLRHARPEYARLDLQPADALLLQPRVRHVPRLRFRRRTLHRAQLRL